VLEGRLNVFACPACRATVMVERTFLYTDLERGHFILVRPMSALPWYARIERDIEDLYHFYVENEPTGRLFSAEQLAAFKVRAVVGYPWLQEKLRLFDADLDDRVVEAMKVAILRDRPELKGYMQLLVDDVRQDELRFIATLEKGRRPLTFGVDRALYELTEDRRDALAEDLPELFEHAFVDLRRYIVRPAEQGAA